MSVFSFRSTSRSKTYYRTDCEGVHVRCRACGRCGGRHYFCHPGSSWSFVNSSGCMNRHEGERWWKHRVAVTCSAAAAAQGQLEPYCCRHTDLARIKRTVQGRSSRRTWSLSAWRSPRSPTEVEHGAAPKKRQERTYQRGTNNQTSGCEIIALSDRQRNSAIYRRPTEHARHSL